LCIFLHSPVTSSLLGPNILISTLFSNTFDVRFSFNVSDQVSHPYVWVSRIKIHLSRDGNAVQSVLEDSKVYLSFATSVVLPFIIEFYSLRNAKLWHILTCYHCQ
jgi:hypothetical protein